MHRYLYCRIRSSLLGLILIFVQSSLYADEQEQKYLFLGNQNIPLFIYLQDSKLFGCLLILLKVFSNSCQKG